MNHLDDDAELYALGLTEPERGAEIEAHLAECDTCRARVVAAEETAASLAAALPPAPAHGGAESPPSRSAPRGRWFSAVAAAAAVIFAATSAIEAGSARAAATQLAQTDRALTAIAASHFGHTTLTSDRGITAKALYARDGSWLYVIVSGAPPGAHVAVRSGGGLRELGELRAGEPATLFTRDTGRADEVDVVSGARIIAHGAPQL